MVKSGGIEVVLAGCATTTSASLGRRRRSATARDSSGDHRHRRGRAAASGATLLVRAGCGATTTSLREARERVGGRHLPRGLERPVAVRTRRLARGTPSRLFPPEWFCQSSRQPTSFGR
jgi:hypothetical protein